MLASLPLTRIIAHRRYRKKVDKDEDYIRKVAMLGSHIEDLVKQNNALDIYEEYFTGVTADHSAEVPNVKTVTIFKVRPPLLDAQRIYHLTLLLPLFRTPPLSPAQPPM